MNWRTQTNYNSHAGAPPRRRQLRPVHVGRSMLARIRTIQTYNSGSPTDSGWSSWGNYDLGWLISGYGTRAGASWTKTEYFIDVAAGIGRPWKILWIDKVTNNSTGAVSYTSEQSQVFVPGSSASVMYDAVDGTTLRLHSALVLIPADGV